MDPASVGAISESRELTSIIDAIIRDRIVIAIEREQRWVEVQKEKRIVQVQQRHDFWKRVRKWGGLLNNWTWAIAIVVGSFSFGVFVGLNVLPEGVVCASKYHPCYWLRFDGRKSAY